MSGFKSFFKEPPISRKVVRGLSREKRGAAEDKEMAAVRRRDKYCRFPLCGCGRFKLTLHVSHQQHRGMGGNPKGDRTKAPILILVCSARHKENITSIDRGTVRWRPLTKEGSNGPVAWDVASSVLSPVYVAGYEKWVEVARETGIHTIEPLTPRQHLILQNLRGMEV